MLWTVSELSAFWTRRTSTQAGASGGGKRQTGTAKQKGWFWMKPALLSDRHEAAPAAENCLGAALPPPDIKVPTGGAANGSETKKKMRLVETSRVFLAAGEGFEPSQTESESVVLPLHNPAICARFRKHECYYSRGWKIVNRIFSFFYIGRKKEKWPCLAFSLEISYTAFRGDRHGISA